MSTRFSSDNLHGRYIFTKCSWTESINFRESDSFVSNTTEEWDVGSLSTTLIAGINENGFSSSTIEIVAGFSSEFRSFSNCLLHLWRPDLFDNYIHVIISKHIV